MLSLAILTAVVGNSIAHANELADSSTFNDWVVNCNDVENSGLECVMSQYIEFEDNSDPLLKIDLYLNPAQTEPQAIFILPLGIPLGTPPSLAFSNGPKRDLKISHCHQDGCYFIESLTPRLLETLLSMSSAELTLRGESGDFRDTIRIPISGSGSRAAYKYFNAIPKN